MPPVISEEMVKRAKRSNHGFTAEPGLVRVAHVISGNSRITRNQGKITGRKDLKLNRGILHN